MQNHPEPEISVFELWRIVIGGWFVIAVSVGIGIALALVLGAAIDTTYRAETVFVEASGQTQPVAGGDGLLGGLAALAGLRGGAVNTGKASAITLMQSRTFAERFIERNNLLPHLFDDYWDAERNEWKGWVPPLWIGASELHKRIAMRPASTIPGATILSIEWHDPEQAAYLADDLIRMANEAARARDIENAERSIAYVNEQMAETNVVELQRVLYSLLEQEQKTLMLANAREDYAFEILDPAIVPLRPFKPNLPQILIAGVVAGLMFGVLFVFVRALVRRWRREQADAI